MSQAGKVIQLEKAQQLEAPAQDVQIAKASVPVEQKPDPAPKADVDSLRTTIGLSNAGPDNRDRDDHDWKPPTSHDNQSDHDWNHDVRQWDRNWVQYDEYYRPILCNPYHENVRIVYVYQNQPRIVVIPPLASIVLSAIDYGAYSFTALVTDAIGTAINVAVGSFFGGGYYPGPYLAPPPPPPPLLTYNDVPVAVDYPDATYQPFTVQRIVDVGDDPQYGEHKVLLDGVTPVWGQWTQNPDGQRQFEVHKTQQFPGMEDPQPGPLPGNYQLKLANDSSPSGVTTKDVFVIAADAVVGTLALCALVAFWVSRRRSRFET